VTTIPCPLLARSGGGWWVERWVQGLSVEGQINRALLSFLCLSACQLVIGVWVGGGIEIDPRSEGGAVPAPVALLLSKSDCGKKETLFWGKEGRGARVICGCSDLIRHAPVVVVVFLKMYIYIYMCVCVVVFVIMCICLYMCVCLCLYFMGAQH
jgi:hypothetical protein